MVQTSDSPEDREDRSRCGWLESVGLPYLMRIPRLAARPACILHMLIALAFTFLWGITLDAVWPSAGRVGGHAIQHFIRAREMRVPFQEPGGDIGVFETWMRFEEKSIRGFLGSVIPGTSLGTGGISEPFLESGVIAGPLGHFKGMVFGFWWLARYHTYFFILFALPVLLIWAFAGGATCRIAAMQFARDDLITYRQSVAYARRKWLNGFVLAPCVPLGMAAFIALPLVLGGVFFRIPILGDLLGGGVFLLAIVGGLAIAVLLLGMATAGHLFWPIVAAEGSDGFDALGPGFSYVFTKPWRTLWYAAVSCVLAAICWVVINAGAYLTFVVTRSVVAFGTRPFGWWAKNQNNTPTSKLELYWPMNGPLDLYHWPDTTGFSFGDYIGAALVGIWVSVMIGLMWAYMASVYFSACTVAYFLLRRDVDGRDFGEVNQDDSQYDERDRTSNAGPPLPSTTG